MPRERLPDHVYRAWIDSVDVWGYAASARRAGLSTRAFRNVGTAWGVQPKQRTQALVLLLGAEARFLKRVRDELETALDMYEAGFWPPVGGFNAGKS